MGVSASQHESSLSSNPCNCCDKKYWARFNKDFFHEGRHKYTFNGWYQGNGRHKDEKCVVKVLKNYTGSKDWRLDLEVNDRATELAINFNLWNLEKFLLPIGDLKSDFVVNNEATELSKEFVYWSLAKFRLTSKDSTWGLEVNKKANEKLGVTSQYWNVNDQKPPSFRPIKFIAPLIAPMKTIGNQPSWVWFNNRDRRYLTDKDYITIEPLITEELTKFNSNSGFSHISSRACKEPDAFSHYTWAMTKDSGNDLVVCDLKGGRNKDAYILTDRAICSRKQNYGDTDLGPDCMARFFKTHKCNEFCKDLPWPKINSERGEASHGVEPVKKTSYSFEQTDRQTQINKFYKNRKDLPDIV